MSRQPNLDLLHQLISAATESECLEFKAAKTSFDSDSFGRYVTALANTAAFKRQSAAYLVFGVDDKTHEVVGSCAYDSKEKQNAALRLLAQSACPNVLIDFATVTAANGRLATIVTVRPARTAVSWKGHYWWRTGESVTAMPLDVINRLCPPADWSGEPCPEASLDSLDAEALRVGREKFKAKHPTLAALVDAEDDLQFLARLRLVTHGKITNGAVILFGKDQSDALLRPAISRITWVLKDHLGVPKSYEHFDCPLMLTAEKAVNCIRILKVPYLKEGSMTPSELPQYDRWVLREALANAIAHQDYLQGHRITITEREDEVTFTNYGSFLPGSIEEVLTHGVSEDLVRNRALAHAMVHLQLMENVGSGIPKMFLSQRERLFPMPEFDFSNGTVNVTFCGKLLNPDVADQLAHDGRLSLLDLFLLDRLLKGRALSKDQLSSLRKKNLVSGRKPAYLSMAATAQESAFTEDNVLQKAILDLFKDQHKNLSLAACLQATLHLLPKHLTPEQQKNKIRNLLQRMKQQDLLAAINRRWTLAEKD